MATTFVALAAGFEETQSAIASTNLYLSAKIGSLVGVNLTSNSLHASLKSGLNTRLNSMSLSAQDPRSITILANKLASSVDCAESIVRREFC